MSVTLRKYITRFLSRFLPLWLRKIKTVPNLVLGVYFLLSLLGHRGIVFAAGTPGHSIDWTIPPTAEALAAYAKASLYLWWDQFLGNFNFYHSYGIFEFMGAFPGLLGIPGWAVAKIWLVSIPALSGYFVYLLTKDLLSTDDSKVNASRISFFAFLSGFFFAFGPFRFNSTMSGEFFHLQLACLFLPLALRYFRRLFLQPSLKNSLLLALSTFFVSANMQVLVFYGVILLCLTPVFLKSRGTASLKNLALAIAVFFLLAAPLLVAFAFVYSEVEGSLYTHIHELGGEALMQSLRSRPSAIPFVEALTVIGYPMDFYLRALPEGAVTPFRVSAALLALLIIGGTLFYAKHSKKELLVYLGLYLVFATFASAGLAPGCLSGWILYLYERYDAMLIFRSPAHFLFPSHFLYSILLGHCFYRLTQKLSIPRLHSYKVSKPLAAFVVSSLLPIMLSVPLFAHGDFAGFLDTFQVPPYYNEVLKPMYADKGDYRIAFVPIGRIPEFLETDYQRGGHVAEDPLVIFSPKPTLDVNRKYLKWSDEFQLLTEKMLYSEPAAMQIPLYLTNIKYVIVRKDVLPNPTGVEFVDIIEDGHTERRYHHLFNLDTQIANLESNQHFKRVNACEQAVVYQLDQVLPRVSAYSLSNAIIISQPEDLETVLNNPDFNPVSQVIIPVYNLSENKASQITNLLSIPLQSTTIKKGPQWESDDIEAGIARSRVDNAAQTQARMKKGAEVEAVNSSNLPAISYTHNTPTHYEITVTAAESTFILVVSDAYHPLWKASLKLEHSTVSNDISERQHFIANGYANAWYIDQAGDFMVTIEFVPQKFYNWGLIISLLTFVAILAAITREFLRKKPISK